MSTTTSATGKTGTSTPTDSTVRPRLRVGEHVVAVQFGAWGPQEVTVRAYSGGGRGGVPYVTVGVGTCLTYAYDTAPVQSHLSAWQDAEQVNRSVRLPEFAPTSATRRHVGEDLSVLCNVTAEQRHSVTSSTGPDGRPVLTVTVTVGAGAVTVHVHTPGPRGARPLPSRTVPSPAGDPQPGPPAPAVRPGRGHAPPMTPNPPAVPLTVPGFVVLDLDLPGRPLLAEAGDYDAGLHTLTAVQEEFYDQLDTNGEGGARVRLALTLAPIDATGTIGPACYWAIINGMRPAPR